MIKLVRCNHNRSILRHTRMPFVSRDTRGAIVTVSQVRRENCSEEIAADHPDLVRFLGDLQSDGMSRLQESDRGFVRVLEDVVDLLIDKELIRLAELPQDAQDKLLQRKQLRRQIRGEIDPG